jgi:predicted dithiol-disulfide oxidoreductase (DUF899 family)
MTAPSNGPTPRRFAGIEFLMGFYPILDRAPKGRDENGAFQTWIRRRDEY